MIEYLLSLPVYVTLLLFVMNIGSGENQASRIMKTWTIAGIIIIYVLIAWGLGLVI